MYNILLTRKASHESEGQHSACQHSKAVVTHGHDSCNEKCLVAKLRHDDDRNRGQKGVDKTQVSFVGVIFGNYWANWMRTWGFLLKVQKKQNTAAR